MTKYHIWTLAVVTVIIIAALWAINRYATGGNLFKASQVPPNTEE